MEGVVFALKESIIILTDLGVPFRKIIASGGGSRSDFWLQLQADIFGMAIICSDVEEQACTGAAITAGYGCGVFSSLEDGCKTIVKYKDTSITPNKELVGYYEQQFEKYREVSNANLPLFK